MTHPLDWNSAAIGLFGGWILLFLMALWAGRKGRCDDCAYWVRAKGSENGYCDLSGYLREPGDHCPDFRPPKEPDGVVEREE